MISHAGSTVHVELVFGFLFSKLCKDRFFVNSACFSDDISYLAFNNVEPSELRDGYFFGLFQRLVTP